MAKKPTLETLRNAAKNTLAGPISRDYVQSERIKKESAIIRAYSDALEQEGRVLCPKLTSRKFKRRELEAAGQVPLIEKSEVPLMDGAIWVNL